MAEITEKSNEQKSEEFGSCTPSSCLIHANTNKKDTLQCKKCERRVHLACSELPPYQIQLYLQHKSRNYQCMSCVIITPELKNKLNFKSVGELQKDIEACENIIKAQREEIVNLKTEVSTNNVNKAVAEIENTFNKRIDVLEGKINKIANKKPSSVNQVACEKSSYSEITKKHLESQTKNIKRFLEKEKTDKKWIEATSCNLMIHHLYETTEHTKEIADKEDIDYIEKEVILKKLNLGEIKVIKSERIGTLTLEKEEKEQYRPLKLTFQSEEDKEKVLKGICNSKRRFEFKATDDLSKNERNLVREWCQKAKERNLKKNDGSFQWKVRGSPRTRLYMKKIFQ